MKVLTCFKVVPDLELLAPEDWEVVENQVDLSFARPELNCFDESALEMTLKLADSSAGFNDPLHITALTIGDQKSETTLRRLLALRFTHVVRVDSEEDLRFAPGTVARLIAAYVQENPCDAAVLGRQSGVGDNAQTPLILAELLGWPCVTQVIDFSRKSDDTLSVCSQLDDGVMTQIIRTPCVLAVGNAQNTYMRVPTLKDKMKHGKRPIEVIPAEDLSAGENPGFAPEEPRLLKLENIDLQRGAVVIDQGTPQEKARRLYEDFLKERLAAA